MQPCGPRAVQAEPAEKDHARDGVGGLSKAGPRQVVVDEPLREESAEQTLHDSGFRVRVVLQDTSDPNSDGLVLDESPLGGAQLKPGATVTLTVGRFAAGGTTTATTPTTP